MDAVGDWARERGATRIDLDVWEVDRSPVEFHEQLGFETRRRTLTRVIE